jgi:hypothetical protein
MKRTSDNAILHGFYARDLTEIFNARDEKHKKDYFCLTNSLNFFRKRWAERLRIK